MAANTTPVFPKSANVQQSQVTTANTNQDGTGALVTVWTPGTNGSLLSKIRIFVPNSNVNQNTIRFFWDDGSHEYQYCEIGVPSGTYSGLAPQSAIEYVPSTPEVYPSGWILKASTDGTYTTNILVIGEDF